MENTALVWQYLFDHPVTPWVVPIPWHLLGVLMVLAILSGLGIHHILSERYGMYRVHDKQDRVMATVGLLVLVASMLVLVTAYAVAANGDRLVANSLRSPSAQVTAGRIGQILMEPIFGPPEVDLTGGQPGTRGQLQDLLLAVPPSEYRKTAQRYLDITRTELAKVSEAEPKPAEKGLPPPREPGESLPAEPPMTSLEDQKEEAPALPLVALALDWASDPDQDWPDSAPKTAGMNQDGDQAGSRSEPSTEPGQPPTHR